MSDVHTSLIFPYWGQILSEGMMDAKLENAKLRAQNEKLRTALRMVLENQGGHMHWDSFGTSGANCPICQRQDEASLQAYEILREAEKPEPYKHGCQARGIPGATCQFPKCDC